MFDMAAVTLGSNLTSPMSGSTGPMGSMTPSGMKFSNSPPHSHSPMSTPASTPNSTMSDSNGKSVTNSNSKDGHLISNQNELFGSKCKRKINFSHLGIPKGHHQPTTVARRNARERNRVKQVNNGFSALKQHIPSSHRSKKMSKVETLKCAVEYIKNLKGMLDLNGALLTSSASSTPSSINSTSGSESDQNHYGANGEFSEGLTHLTHHHHHQQHLNGFGQGTVPAGSHQLSPTSSDDPSSPSYASEASYITTTNANIYDYENYEPVSPEDEELLDAISWWQQS